MKAVEIEVALQQRLARPVNQLTPQDGIAAMCDFYSGTRVDGAAIENDRDMLLYQWGVDTFNTPNSFQLNITRQLNIAGESQPYQLALAFHYPAAGALANIALGNQWCRSPGELPAFRQFVELSEAYQAVAESRPERATLNFERRG